MADFDEVRDQYHSSLRAFIKGDPEPTKRLWSRGDDVTLANPIGPPVRGWDAVRETMEHAASLVCDGEDLSRESISTYTTPDLVCELALERCRLRVVGGADAAAPITLRVTTTFRREDDGWKIVHRHADPIAGPRPIESVLQ